MPETRIFYARFGHIRELSPMLDFMSCIQFLLTLFTLLFIWLEDGHCDINAQEYRLLLFLNTCLPGSIFIFTYIDLPLHIYATFLRFCFRKMSSDEYAIV